MRKNNRFGHGQLHISNEMVEDLNSCTLKDQKGLDDDSLHIAGQIQNADG